MSEVNHNATASESKSMLSDQSDCAIEQNEVTATVSGLGEQLSASEAARQSTEIATNASTNSSESFSRKTDWQKVAHKLREHNRKLYKNIFRLEQELAELDNKFNKYVEKSQNSDLFLAQQAEEIKQYQENIALLTQQLATSQDRVKKRDCDIKQVSEQHQLSQNQTTQLEREYTSLQEKYDRQALKLAARDRENQELNLQLSQQQQTVLHQEAELKRYREAETSRKASSRQQNYPHNKYIQPWKTSALAEPKIAIPKSKPAQTRTATTKAAANIATKSPAIPNRLEAKISSKVSNTTKGKKPQSLAAVDLPTFPRPQ